ncbi:MAG: hypothetical protein AAF529_00290 [Pseudomonadota bacterium]
MTTLSIIGDQDILTRQAAHLANVIGYRSIEVFSDAQHPALAADVIQRPRSAFAANAKQTEHVFYALLDPQARSTALIAHRHGELINLIHPSAVVSPTAELGKNIYVDANSVIGVDAQVADGVVQNALAAVEHDNRISRCAFLGTGAILCGHVSLGEFTFIGGGATVKPGTAICANTMVGTGTVVVQNITAAGTYVGNPARRMEKS